MNRIRMAWLAAGILLASAGCEPLKRAELLERDSGPAQAPAVPEAEPAASSADEPHDAPRTPRDFVDLGTGAFVKIWSTEHDGPHAGGVTLNFQHTPIADAAQAILGDILGANYVIDPMVQGTATLHTTRPVPHDDLIPTLEMLLRANDAAVVLQHGVYHVLPREKAAGAALTPQLGDLDAAMPEGYTIRVVPVQYVSVREMAEILEPFAPAGSIMRADTARNLLLLAGNTTELDGLTETVRIFDVDWLEGMSFGLFTPDFVSVDTLVGELSSIFDQVSGPLAGLVKFVPIKRLNALLVVSPRPEYLEKVKEWVERLDHGNGSGEDRLFVYHVQHGEASDLAQVLEQVFEGSESLASAATGPARIAPGLEPVDIRSDDPEQVSMPREMSGIAVSDGGLPIHIVPDDINNALLIRAGVTQYRQVRSVLEELDRAPLQVLIEATIAEVSLSDEWSLGVEWFLENGLDGRAGIARLDLGVSGIGPATGFSYVIRSAGDVRFVLNALASDSRLNVISSPSLMVLNHQTASIQVGDQVPITTQQQQATSTDSNIVNNIEFRDTGVLLTVKPRVNASGLVVMEIQQEVSDVAPNSSALTPTIQQRKIESTVAVQSGDTIVLGGLIRENQSESQSGVPGLSRIPVLGHLFSASKDTDRRTELIVLITPRAVQDPNVARGITEEFRSRMDSLRSFFESGLRPAEGPP